MFKKIISIPAVAGLVFALAGDAQGVMITSMSASAPTTNVVISQTAADNNTPFRWERPAGDDRNPRDTGETFLSSGFVLDKITVNIATLATTAYDSQTMTLAIQTFSNGSDFTPDSTVVTEGGSFASNMKSSFDSGNTYLTFDITDVTLSAGQQYGFLLMHDTQQASGDNMLLAAQNNSGYTDGIGITREQRGAGGDNYKEMTVWTGSSQPADLEFYLHHEPTMLWRTDEADDWAGEDWTNDGGATFIAPIADEVMVVNSGTATVSTDVSGTAAKSLEIARDAAGGTVEIASGGTLAVTGGVNVGDGGTLNVNGLLSVGGMNVAAGGTLALGDDSSGAAGMLVIDNDLTDIQLTNITMGGGAMVRSTAARAPANNVTITVDGTLRVDGGNPWVGDFFGPDPGSNSDGDQSFTNLTLTETARYEWSFTKSDAVDELWSDDGLFVVGTVNLADGLEIQLVDGGGSSAGIAGGVDVALFIPLNGAVFDPSKITVEAPDGLDWTWDTLIDGEGHEYPDLQFSDNTLVLKGLVTGVVAPHAGDANDDKIVDADDLVLFDQQFGGTPGTTGVDNCDFDGDGDVDIDDFSILRDEWGWQLSGAPDAGPGASSATPEPATMSLLALGALAVLRRRRRK